jgi:hypothetical protein
MPETAAPSPLGVVCLVPAFTDIMSSDARGASAVYVRTQPRCGGSFSFLILKEQIKGIIIIREEGCFLCVSGVCKFWGFLETHKTAMVRNVIRVPSPNRYMAFAKFCFCKNNKRTII